MEKKKKKIYCMNNTKEQWCDESIFKRPPILISNYSKKNF